MAEKKLTGKPQEKPTNKNKTEALQIFNEENIASRAKEFKDLLPEYVNFKKVYVSMLALIENEASLEKCTDFSKFNALREACELGLDFNKARSHLYLVAYGNQAQLQISYRGMIELILRSGAAENVDAEIIYSNEKYSVTRGDDKKLVHEIMLEGDIGEPIASYVFYDLPNGKTKFVVIRKDEIEAARKKSKMPQGLAWSEFWWDMWRKCAIRKSWKSMSTVKDIEHSSMLDKAIEIDNRNYTIDEEPPEVVPPLEAKKEKKQNVVDAEYEETDSDELTEDEYTEAEEKILELMKKEHQVIGNRSTLNDLYKQYGINGKARNADAALLKKMEEEYVPKAEEEEKAESEESEASDGQQAAL